MAFDIDAEAADILKEVSGGNEVCADIGIEEVKRIINGEYDKIKPWISFPSIMETVAPTLTSDSSATSGGGSCYILKTSLSKKVDFVEKLYPTERLSGIARDFLGVPGFLITSHPSSYTAVGQGVIEYSEWLILKQQLLEAFRQTPDFKETPTHILINPAFPMITVEYHPAFEAVADLMDPHVKEHLMDRSTEMVKLEIGYVRRKMQGAPLAFELDGSDMVNEAITALEGLDEELRNLTPNLEPM